MEEKPLPAGKADLDMLMGLTKHIAGLGDTKKKRVSTTMLALQETLREKMV